MHPIAISTWGDEEVDAIQDVVFSGKVTMGQKTKAFEKAFAELNGSEYCVAVNSGSSANLLMVAAMSLRQGVGTVIVPAISWATSYAPFQQYGWKLKFVDIDRETLNYDMEKLNEAFTGDELILAVNLLGNPNDFRNFPALGNQILEDNCESMGAIHSGFPTGNFGAMGSHSTYFSHHICTMEGGLITTDDPYYYEMLLSLRSHGWTRHLPENNLHHSKRDSYEFIYPGYNVRPTDMQSAIGLEQIKKLPDILTGRRDNARSFPLKKHETGNSSWFGFPIISERIEEIKEYFDENEIEYRPILSHFTKSEAIKYFDYEIHGELTNADYVHKNGIYIGNGHKPVDWSFLDNELFDDLKHEDSK